MSKTLSIRIDHETESEIAVLAGQAGSRNAAIVGAIREAYRRQVLEQVRTESAALSADPEYLADVQGAREAMGEDHAW